MKSRIYTYNDETDLEKVLFRPDSYKAPQSRIHMELSRFAYSFRSEVNYLNGVTTYNPSIAGDQAEKSWMKFILGILPEPYFKVFTKKCIRFDDGTISPELDIVITKGMPRISESNYLDEHFIVAAIEVKLKLRTSHLKKTFETSVKLNRSKRRGSIRNELCRKIIFGVVAHTSEFTTEKLSFNAKSEKESKRLANDT
ncbi:hypothetical protein H5232_12765 [Pseudoalteromonas sp. SG41-5]|uniref:DUF6602 domain-containing protein n=1 Tax=Pseudoalteromonas sp. SG41-5 TaxID=2760975 RepID=UPI0016039FC5|nr:DUF6602 domain-containing protein [Pseudoalteromonas sp. SG41-5]MBB1469308.1 hypothetical protein [Pseudoalteromonas sp. SG41-5]